MSSRPVSSAIASSHDTAWYFASPPIAGSLQRLRDAVRVIRDLDRRLAARAQAAVVHGMLGRALQLLRGVNLHHAGLPVAHHVAIGVHHADRKAAAGGAHRAHARLPGCLAGDDVLVRHEADERVLGAAATTGQRGGGAADGGELDEGAAIHQKWQVRQSSGACLSLWQFTQKPMVRSTVRCATVCWPIGPWHVSHAISLRMCGAWLNLTCEAAG